AMDGGFWTLGTNQLTLRGHAASGVVSHVVSLKLPYFEAWEGPLDRKGLEGFDFPPRPRHSLMYDSGEGRIVILTQVIDKRWKPTPSDRMFKPSERNENELYD